MCFTDVVYPPTSQVCSTYGTYGIDHRLIELLVIQVLALHVHVLDKLDSLNVQV